MPPPAPDYSNQRTKKPIFRNTDFLKTIIDRDRNFNLVFPEDYEMLDTFLSSISKVTQAKPLSKDEWIKKYTDFVNAQQIGNDEKQNKLKKVTDRLNLFSEQSQEKTSANTSTYAGLLETLPLLANELGFLGNDILGNYISARVTKADTLEDKGGARVDTIVTLNNRYAYEKLYNLDPSIRKDILPKMISFLVDATTNPSMHNNGKGEKDKKLEIHSLDKAIQQEVLCYSIKNKYTNSEVLGLTAPKVVVLVKEEELLSFCRYVNSLVMLENRTLAFKGANEREVDQNREKFINAYRGFFDTYLSSVRASCEKSMAYLDAKIDERNDPKEKKPFKELREKYRTISQFISVILLTPIDEE